MASRAERLATDPNVWLAAVRADGRPHLTPIWFVYVDDHMWLCTGVDAVKARLVRANPRVSIALEDGNAPVAGEGTATVRPVDDAPPGVRAAFRAKYQWDIAEDPGYVLVDIVIAKWLSPGSTVTT